MENSPLISVIVPVYNTGSFLKKCLDSIVLQTYKNLEIILINDESKDNSLDICQKYAQNDSRIKVLDIKYKKISGVRNIGLQNAMGEYIVFVDSDDYIDKEMIQKLYNAVKEYDICMWNYYVCKSNNVKVKSIVQNFEVDCNNLNEYIEKVKDDLLFNLLWNKIYSSKIIKNNEIKFEDDVEVGEDYLFNIRYLNHVKKAKYINEALYYYKVSKNSLSRKYIQKDIRSEMQLLRELKDFYEKHEYSLQYVYMQYLLNFNININNLIKGKCLKKDIYLYMQNLILEYEKDNILNNEFKDEMSFYYRLVCKLILKKDYKNLLRLYKLVYIIKKII